MPRLASSFRLAGVALLVFVQIWILWPSSFMRAEPPAPLGLTSTELSTQAQKDPPFPGFEPPEGASPDYSMDGVHYISVLKGERQWQLTATEADFYSSAQWVHARNVKAELFDRDGPSIHVEGKQARYSLATRDLDIGGDVIARFPDGSTLRMELLEFRPATKQISVPVSYRVKGTGPTRGEARMRFESFGLVGRIDTEIVELKERAFIEVQNRDKREHPTQSWSARAVYQRRQGLMDLFSGGEPVRMEQGTLRSTANQMQIGIPQKGSGPSFEARDEVRIEEWKDLERSAAPFRLSTSGRARFDPATQQVILTEYPQVYQDGDTMTGEVIRILRREDQVEIEHPNAFTTGRSKE
jgi:LPS export ABC transporter protein LptC